MIDLLPQAHPGNPSSRPETSLAEAGATPAPVDPSPHPRSERALQQEFGGLLEPILGPAFGLAMNMTRNRDDAEDVVQEAVLLAFRGFRGFQRGTNFKAWFYKILTNVYRRRYTRQQRDPQTTSLDDAPALFLWTKTGELGMHAPGADPAKQVLDKLDAQHVQAAIKSLPEDFREVAALYFLEDFAYQEIAEILECPVGTVRSRLHRGRRLLQKALWEVAQGMGLVAESAD